ncbi:hypothetical protein T484DRAFT_3649600, partial [Baffinella frigidus]
MLLDPLLVSDPLETPLITPDRRLCNESFEIGTTLKLGALDTPQQNAPAHTWLQWAAGPDGAVHDALRRLIISGVEPSPSGLWPSETHTQPHRLKQSATDLFGNSSATSGLDGIRRSDLYLDNEDPTSRGDVWTTHPTDLRDLLTHRIRITQAQRDKAARYDLQRPDKVPWTITTLALESTTYHTEPGKPASRRFCTTNSKLEEMSKPLTQAAELASSVQISRIPNRSKTSPANITQLASHFLQPLQHSSPLNANTALSCLQLQPVKSVLDAVIVAKVGMSHTARNVCDLSTQPPKKQILIMIALGYHLRSLEPESPDAPKP